MQRRLLLILFGCLLTTAVATAKTIYSADFTTWTAATYTEQTDVNGIRIWATEKKTIAVSANGISFSVNSSSGNSFIGVAIPLSGTEGEVTVKLNVPYTNGKATYNYAFVGGSDVSTTSAPANTSRSAVESGGVVTITFSSEENQGVLYIGRNGSSYPIIRSIEVSSSARVLIRFKGHNSVWKSPKLYYSNATARNAGDWYWYCDWLERISTEGDYSYWQAAFTDDVSVSDAAKGEFYIFLAQEDYAGEYYSGTLQTLADTVWSTGVSCFTAGNLNGQTDITSEYSYTYEKPLTAGSLFPITADDADYHKYYASLVGKSGTELRNAIYEIENQHKKVTSYQSLREAYAVTDYRTYGTIWDMYSNCSGTYRNSDGTSGGVEECSAIYNREHSCPKSWWEHNNSSCKQMFTDIMHVIPTNSTVNSARSYWPYSEVGTATTTYGNGTKVGTSSFSGYSGTAFEPADEYKGDLARIYMYMVTCYKDQNITTGSGSQVFSYSSSTLDFTTFGKNLFMKWAAADPVSEKEKTRNDGVQSIQGNRNPFVDLPNLANYLWGSKAGKPYSFVDESDSDSGSGSGSNDCEALNVSLLTDGLGDCTGISITGDQAWRWASSSSGTYASCSGYQSGTRYENEDWLLTPAYDLSGMKSATLSFEHTINYANSMVTEQTLWYSTNYAGDVASASWTQIEIPTYPTGSGWTFVTATIDLPAAALQSNVVFAFKYICGTTAAATWEIRNLTLTSECKQIDSSLNPSNLQVSFDNMYATFTWDAPATAKRFFVKIYVGSKTADMVDDNCIAWYLCVSPSLNFFIDATYKNTDLIWQVCSVDEENSEISDYVVGSVFRIPSDAIDYAPSNLSATVDDYNVTFSWNAQNPVRYYYLGAYSKTTNGDDVYSTIVDCGTASTATQYLTIDFTSYGADSYGWYLRAVNDEKTRYLTGPTYGNTFTMSDSSEDGAITVRCYPNGIYKEVWLWAWTDNGNVFDTNWPGIQLTADADGSYAYTFDESLTSVNIIWNDGMSSGESSAYQTADINGVTKSTCYRLLSLDGADYGRSEYAEVDCSNPLGKLQYKIDIYALTGGTVSNNGGTYEEGSTISVSATPYSGYKFVGWSDGVTTASRTVTADANKTIYAYFAPQDQGAITVKLKNNGDYGKVYINAGNNAGFSTGWPGTEITEKDGNGWYTYTFPENVKFLEYMHFNDSYANGKTNNDGDAIIYMTSSYYDIVQNTCFELLGLNPAYINYEESQITECLEEPVINIYTLTVTAGTGGTVNNVSGEYEEGTEVTLIATRNAGYKFSQWSDGNKDNPRVITITRDLTLQAQFVSSSGKMYQVKVMTTPGGLVNKAMDEQVEEGELLHLVAIPNKGYQFYSWSDGVDEADRYVMVEQDILLFAAFLREYTLTVSAGAGGTVNETVNGIYTSTMCAEIEATPADGYRFLRWSDGDRANPRTLRFADNKTLQAVFEAITGLDALSDGTTLYVEGKTLRALFTQARDLYVYGAAGQLIAERQHITEASIPLTTGMYLVRVGDKVYKVIVK